jgi:hypothetical protein
MDTANGRARAHAHTPESDEEMTRLVLRVRGEYREMPGLRLTVRQAARLFSLPPDVAHSVLDELRQATVLTCSSEGSYSLTQ